MGKETSSLETVIGQMVQNQRICSVKGKGTKVLRPPQLIMYRPTGGVSPRPAWLLSVS